MRSTILANSDISESDILLMTDRYGHGDDDDDDDDDYLSPRAGIIRAGTASVTNRSRI